MGRTINYESFINGMLSESSTQNEIMENEMFSRKERERLENNILEREYYYSDYQEDTW